MFQPASVSLSGPAFSFLLYETYKATVGQYGFLLGEIIHKEITSITDNDQKQVDISKIIKINSVIPWPCRNYFPKGRVDEAKLRNLLGTNFSKVIAWYKYESSSSVKFTLKDKAFHKQFREIFDVPPDIFSVCILSVEYTDNYTTYNYLQNFFRYYDTHYDKLHISIPNLSESNSIYKKSEPASDVFNKILSKLKIDIENTKGVAAVTEIGNAVQNYIKKTVLELAEAEQHLFKLEEEVRLLGEDNQPQTIDNIEDIVMDTSPESTSSDDTQIESATTETTPRRSPRAANISESSRKVSLCEFLPDTPTPQIKGKASGRAKPRGARGGK